MAPMYNKKIINPDRKSAVKGRKRTVTKCIAVLVLMFLIYPGYRVYKSRRHIVVENRTYGFGRRCKQFPPVPFNRGQWQGVVIDADIVYTDGAHNVFPYDLDHDGKAELIANSYRSDVLMFYKEVSNSGNPHRYSRFVIDSSVGGGNPRAPLTQFVKSVLREKLLGAYISGAHYTAIADMNGDGRKDLVVAGDLKRYDVLVYESPKEVAKTAEWKKHCVYSNDSHRTYHVETGDIDGDGARDIVFTTKTDNSLGWLRNIGGSREWPVIWIDKSCTNCFYARVADLDKDGQAEIVASEDDSIHGGKLHVYTYSDNPMEKENWVDNVVADFPPGHGVSVFDIIDIDGDGDLDIVTGSHQGEVFIVRNPFPSALDEKWSKHQINSDEFPSGHDFREIDVGDLDKDGDLDIVVADEHLDMVIWFENVGPGAISAWQERVIDQSSEYLQWCHSAKVGDIDGDGDLDIVVAGAASNAFFVYFNNLIGTGSEN